MHQSKEKLVLSTREFFHLIEVENIVYCQSDNTYTTFFMTDGKEIKVSVPIKIVEQKLDKKAFICPHQLFLVNVQHIRSVHKVAGGELLLDNGKVISIASQKKSEVLHFLADIARIQV